MTHLHSINVHWIVIARDISPEHDESRQFPLKPLCFLSGQGFATDEAGLLELDDPSKASLKKGCCPVKIVAVEKKFCFEPQRVSGAQSRSQQARRFAGFKNAVPERFGLRRGKVEFKTVFAGISRAGQRACRLPIPCRRRSDTGERRSMQRR